ncbi:MAG: histidine phosphatase family protein [Desulfatibacillum sp.]|nr:histidine phosphatase family protein [Desulfatibacillum sp.]
MEAENTRFVLIRHAQTKWNVLKLMQGREDSPLTRKGKDEARVWGKALKSQAIDRIVASPLNRAVETALLINETLGLPLSQETGFMEQSWGRWEGMTLEEIKAESPVILESMVSRGWDFKPPGGESRLQVLARCTQAMQSIHEKWPGQTILIVAHTGVIKCITYHILGRAFLPSEPACLMRNRAHIVRFGEGGLEMEALNAISPG